MRIAFAIVEAKNVEFSSFKGGTDLFVCAKD